MLVYCSNQDSECLRRMGIQRISGSEISNPPFSKYIWSLLTRLVPLESCVSLLSRYTTRFVFPARFQFAFRRNLQRHNLKQWNINGLGSVFWTLVISRWDAGCQIISKICKISKTFFLQTFSSHVSGCAPSLSRIGPIARFPASIPCSPAWTLVYS